MQCGRAWDGFARAVVALTAAVAVQAIPLSVRARIAEVQCKSTVQRNPQLFAGCNEQFLSRVMLNLVEVFFLPGETVLKHGDIARELSFAKRGVVMVMDVKDTLVELVSGEGALPHTALGAARQPAGQASGVRAGRIGW